MSKDEGYGRRGGAGPTSGKKVEVIEATLADGRKIRKSVFKGQRALTLLEYSGGVLVQAWVNLAAAEAFIARVQQVYTGRHAAQAEVVS